MNSVRIFDLPLKEPIGSMKIPTGGFGDVAVSVDTLKDYVKGQTKFTLETFTMATLPPASEYANMLIHISDFITTPTLQPAIGFSDGTKWYSIALTIVS